MENFHSASEDPKKSSVLFFGRNQCLFSQKAYEHLQHIGFDVTKILSNNRKERLLEDIDQWVGEYIICFRSHFILPIHLIDRASIAAINFHPAPAEYPGSGCLNWALYDNAKTYGATAHIMNEKVDNGTIIECRRFPVSPQDNVTTLLARTHLETFNLFADITTGLATDGKNFLNKKIDGSKDERWRGKARKISEIDQLQIVNSTFSKQELERVIRATHTPSFPLKIHLHGYEFILKLES